MKISYNWLKDYVGTDLSAENVSYLLTSCGLEVEGMERIDGVKGGLEKFFVGEVMTCELHPDSDHLHITTVDVGREEVLNIVCGAPNVDKGQKVIVATIGAKIYTSDEEYFEIKRSKLRGVASEGMICSEAELQLSNNHDGIMVIDENAIPGTPAKDYLNIKEDYVFEIGLTPNRSDAASHIGVGRDLAALLQVQKSMDIKLSLPSVRDFKIDNNSKNVEITIDNSICTRYSGITISNIEVKDSPDWLASRLRTIGIKPINNIVDITNYLMFENGQPLHAFDLDKIDGNKIEVRKRDKDESFITLDNVERKLNGEEIMICDANKALCMGGIYGGIGSGVSLETKSIFLESACFNPVLIRKASKYHNLKTDASFRFERGSDANITIYALKRAAKLIKEASGGEISSEIIDIYPNKVENPVIDFSLDNMERLIGREIPEDTVKMILIALGFEILSSENRVLKISIPTFKVDVLRECDVIEEVIRIFGYDNIEISHNIKTSISYEKKSNSETIQNNISDLLVSNGFFEIMNNSLSKISYYENNNDYPMGTSVNILNALSKDLGVMRQSLIYGGLETLAYNLNRKAGNIKVFEFGNVYSKNLENSDNENVEKRYNEEKHLILCVTGNRAGESWIEKSPKLDFYYIKNIAFNILERLGIDSSRFIMQESSLGVLNSGIELIHRDNKKRVLYIGKVSTPLLKGFDIKQDVFVADFNWDLIFKAISNKDIKYQEVAKFPEVRRDLALVMDMNISFEDLSKLAFQSEKKLLKDINLFDVYQGDKLPEGKKQYALSFVLQDKDKTLNDKQIEGVMNKLIKAFEDKLNAKLR